MDGTNCVLEWAHDSDGWSLRISIHFLQNKNKKHEIIWDSLRFYEQRRVTLTVPFD